MSLIKVWFYVEGYSEQSCALFAVRKHFPAVFECKSEIDFLNENEKSCFYIHNSKDVDKIPYDMVNNCHWIERSNATHVIVVCDTEKSMGCPQKRKSTIYQIIDKDTKNKKINIDRNIIYFVCSTPIIEKVYCDEPEILIKILKSLRMNIHGKDLITSTDESRKILAQSEKHIKNIEDLFDKNNVKFKKREIAEKFFAQLDYKKCKSPSIKRFYDHLYSILK